MLFNDVNDGSVSISLLFINVSAINVLLILIKLSLLIY